MDSAWRTAQASCIWLNSIFTRIQNIDANRVLWWVGVSFPILTSSNKAFMFLVYQNGQFTGQTAEGCYGRSQSDPQLLVFTLLCNHPPECEQDRWLLTNRTWQRWWDATPMIIFYYIKLCLSRVTLVLEGVSHYVMNFPWGRPCGRELREPEEQRPSTSTTSHKEMNSVNDLMILETNSSPVETPNENAAHWTLWLQLYETLRRENS